MTRSAGPAAGPRAGCLPATQIARGRGGRRSRPRPPGGEARLRPMSCRRGRPASQPTRCRAPAPGWKGGVVMEGGDMELCAGGYQSVRGGGYVCVWGATLQSIHADLQVRQQLGALAQQQQHDDARKVAGRAAVERWWRVQQREEQAHQLAVCQQCVVDRVALAAQHLARRKRVPGRAQGRQTPPQVYSAQRRAGTSSHGHQAMVGVCDSSAHISHDPACAVRGCVHAAKAGARPRVRGAWVRARSKGRGSTLRARCVGACTQQRQGHDPACAVHGCVHAAKAGARPCVRSAWVHACGKGRVTTLRAQCVGACTQQRQGRDFAFAVRTFEPCPDHPVVVAEAYICARHGAQRVSAVHSTQATHDAGMELAPASERGA
eukprot:366232-Chlamydomonas_euryale.AAC.22